MAKLLLIEDDVRLATLMAEYLGANGHEVGVEHRGDLAVDRILSEKPDLVVLDLMLPGEDGLSICRRVRPNFPGPILMLTARGEEIDQVVGLEVGADDYVGKPVSPRLLLARVSALLRRAVGAPVGDRLEFGDLYIDRSTREVHAGAVMVELTSAEFDLLWMLAEHAGQPVTREDLLRELRGIEWDGLDRSIDVRCSGLRRKLAEYPGHEDRIKTVRGVGYQLSPAD